MFNRRYAMIGWLVWNVAKQVGKRKAKKAVPDGRHEKKRSNKAAIVGAIAGLAITGWLVGKLKRQPEAPATTSRSLVRPALDELVPYEPGKPVEEVQRELGLERVVKLASNEGPYGPFPAALEALAAAAPELNRYPDGGAYRLREALAARHGVRFEEIAPAPGADARRRLPRAGAARPGRRDRLRLAVLPELRHRRAEARRRPADRPAARPPLRPGRAARRGRPAHEDRLRLLPEQPDRHDEHPGRARRLLRPRPRPRRHGRRPGVLRVRHRPGLRRRGRVPQGGESASSCCARSRRSTGSRGCASATASARPTS